LGIEIQCKRGALSSILYSVLSDKETILLIRVHGTLNLKTESRIRALSGKVPRLSSLPPWSLEEQAWGTTEADARAMVGDAAEVKEAGW
jgi:hypothetical protein